MLIIWNSFCSSSYCTPYYLISRWYDLRTNKEQVFVMPPPLGTGGIMFSGCPPVRPSFRPSEAWNTLFPPVHESVGPSDQPWPFCGMSVRPSGEVSRHLLENTWREWPEFFYAVVSWPPAELIKIWSRSVDFPPFGATLTTGQIWGFRAFPGERIERMAWKFECWCILTTFKTD